MRDLEPFRGFGRVGGRIDRPRACRPIDIDAMAAVQQQVEVELARAPSGPCLAATAALDRLERREEVQGVGFRAS